MANPTTNYGFVLPTSTDLVTDLPADFDVALQGVDTRLKALQPGTTLGDITYSSATANTNTRLGIGTAGQVLTVNSGATAPEWATPAAGMTLLSTTTLTGASTTISSISQSYKALLVYIYGVTNATADNSFFVHPNSVTNTAYTTGTINGTANNSAASNGIPLYWNGNPDRTSSNNASTLWIYNYASSTNYKNHTVNSVYQKSGSVIEYNSFGGGIITNTAITALKFISSGGSLSSGTVLIYGVN